MVKTIKDQPSSTLWTLSIQLMGVAHLLLSQRDDIPPASSEIFYGIGTILMDLSEHVREIANELDDDGTSAELNKIIGSCRLTKRD